MCVNDQNGVLAAVESVRPAPQLIFVKGKPRIVFRLQRGRDRQGFDRFGVVGKRRFTFIHGSLFDILFADRDPGDRAFVRKKDEEFFFVGDFVYRRIGICGRGGDRNETRQESEKTGRRSFQQIGKPLAGKHRGERKNRKDRTVQKKRKRTGNPPEFQMYNLLFGLSYEKKAVAIQERNDVTSESVMPGWSARSRA